jgi:hypothetical protein
MVSTPQAFRVALSETEIWAVLAAEKGAERGGGVEGGELLDAHRHGSLGEDPTVKLASEASKPRSKQLNSVLNSLRSLRSQFQSPPGGIDLSSSIEDASNWPHDRKGDGRTVCLWSDASEVSYS